MSVLENPITKTLAIRRVQSIILHAAQEYFYRHGFEQLMPVILSPITDPLGPDPGSSVIKTGEIEYLGQKLQLTQSMILHKQVAIGMGLEKFFIVSPNVRLESPKRAASGVHLFEFSQIDFELRDAKSEDVFVLLEDLFRYIRRRVEGEGSDALDALGRELPEWGRFPVYTIHEMIEKHGDDWEKAASMEHKTPFFVTCHKREFYDKRDRAVPGEHYLNYDLYYPEGFLEALSGAEREHEYNRLVERLTADGFSLESYKSYIELAKDGKLAPSAGGGFGVERMVRYFTGAAHVGDIQPFRRVPGEEIKV